MINPSDDIFINNIKHYLVGFKKSNNNYNFRCPFCGDSAKSKTKQRGWLIDYKGSTFFKCFNCGLSYNFTKFLKLLNEDLYRQYILTKPQRFNNEIEEVVEKKESKYITKEIFEQNKFVQSCAKSNPGRQYLLNRKLTHPELFYYTLDYGSLLKSLNLTEYQLEWAEHEPRLILPHWDRNNELAFLQFRNLNPYDKIRYK